ncbi:hypothetical protein [Paenibacillus thermotolerans]|uniref:MotE family protein n=1 Tax=Paenibacillus thermotolerans TaxID=3027807 RepID=UPI002367ED4F|nr:MULTISPECIES: hypothetical protein [unclassified Paenibacillus]
MPELEAEKSYGWFERFLFYTLPVLFTLLLTGVLLTVFGYDVMNEALRIANKIPVVSSVIPDPKPTGAELQNAIKQAESGKSDEKTYSEAEYVAIQRMLEEKQTQLSQLNDEAIAKDDQIAKLTQEVKRLQERLDSMTQSDEEYAASIKNLADIYARMSPSKAAPVIESLTMNERVLVLSRMKQDKQVGILEKMDPKIAADTSIRLKDVMPAKDLQIAALQDRLEANAGAKTEAGGALTKSEVSDTFAKMSPDNAAAVLLEMSKSNLTQVVNILRLMEPAARASVLNSLTGLSETQTAKITAKLG